MTETGFIESFRQRYPDNVLSILLQDHTTGRNIIWADDEYHLYGEGFQPDDEVTLERITGKNAEIIKTRVSKETERQSLRTKSHAEVFTPSWLVNTMNNNIDREWFNCDVFNTTDDEKHLWQTLDKPVHFPKKKGMSWTAYVKSPRMEITCGEAPFLCSRYDTVTGNRLKVKDRVGVLDRKLRVISENAASHRSWERWALEALKATYGYEYQGDNLLIARINILETVAEHYSDRWGASPDNDLMVDAAKIVSWNLWQMDGLTDTVPSSLPPEKIEEQKSDVPNLFDLAGLDFDGDTTKNGPVAPLCMIYDWNEGKTVTFTSLKG